MKRITICMDGTWQKLRQDRPTNIGIIARSIAHRDGDVPQIVLYTQGVGSSIDALDSRHKMRIGALGESLASFAGGLFGEGLEDAILDTYLRLAFNYEPGDEIYIFGFSRGAFSARSLAALIGKCGIVSRRFAEKAPDAFEMYRDPNISPDSERAREFRLKYGKREYVGPERRHADHRPLIKYLGIFDTVGQRGLPSALGVLSNWTNRRYAFHDLALGGHVHSARHALAIDERRRAFPPTLWSNLGDLKKQALETNTPCRFAERWFIGRHGDVGGGSESTLSSFPLAWIVEGAALAGLAFDRTRDSPLNEALHEACLDPGQIIRGPGFFGALHPINWSGTYRKILPPKTVGTRDMADELLDVSVAMRTVSPSVRKRYLPPTLRPFKDSLYEIAGPAAVFVALAKAFSEKRSRKQKK